ncbi:MAG: hypothetical protein N3A72_04335 [bacterium]|nr:hypothetical protein [bacterium]
MTGWEIFGIWLAAGLTIAIYSFLYKDNPAYKLAEHIYVGISAGYTVCIAYFNVIDPNLIKELTEKRNFIVLIPAVLGLLMYSRFFKKFSWISRISIAFVIGAGAGISVPNSIQALLLKHTSATIAPLFSNDGFQINSLIIIVGVTAVLIYFFFSIEQGKGLKTVSWLGIIFIMVSFGASFGYTVMGRVSLVIGRIRFLLTEWAPLVFQLFNFGK